MIQLSAIVLAAGRGKRFKSRISKPLARINSKPIIIYCLQILNKHPFVSDITVVVNEENSKEIINRISQYRIDKVTRIVKGGLRRQDSVARALSAIDKKTDFILIHDGARPFINGSLISSVMKAATRCGAAIVGVPVKTTIKEVTKSPCLSLPVPACPAGRRQAGGRRATGRQNSNKTRTWSGRWAGGRHCC